MANKKFLIAVGGTGMRCLEAFIHLCAIGMADGEEFHILSIDTDHQNGNMNRTDQLIQWYLTIRMGQKNKQLDPQRNTFFSAKIHHYKYNTEHSQRDGLTTFSDKANIRQGSEEKELADLLFTDEVQSMDLGHGYRAQTHLGSLLMYHELIEEVKMQRNLPVREQQGKLIAFLKQLRGEVDGKVFNMGSIFGGTGASSLPVLPRFIRDSMFVFEDPQPLDKSVTFGGTLLTNYFKFDVNDDQRRREKVIADSTFFALNSQAAMVFYHDDTTISQSYRRLYHIGWPIAPQSYQKQNSDKTLTGGTQQENPAHVAELISAFAALDFFQNNRGGGHTKYFRTVNYDGEMQKLIFDFKDFTGEKQADKFEQQLSSFLGMSYVLNSRSFDGNFAHFISNINQTTQNAYKLPSEDITALEAYFKNFGFTFNGDSMLPGWWFQIKDSVGYEEFLFSARAYDASKLSKFNWGEISQDPNHHFSFEASPKPVSKFNKMMNRNKKKTYADAFDYFKESFNRTLDTEKSELTALSDTTARFLKHMYLAMKAAFRYY